MVTRLYKKFIVLLACLCVSACGGGRTNSGGGDFENIAGVYRGKVRAVLTSQDGRRSPDRVIELEISAEVQSNGTAIFRSDSANFATVQFQDKLQVLAVSGAASVVLQEQRCQGNIGFLVNKTQAPRSLSGFWSSRVIQCFDRRMSISGDIKLLNQSYHS